MAWVGVVVLRVALLDCLAPAVVGLVALKDLPSSEERSLDRSNQSRAGWGAIFVVSVCACVYLCLCVVLGEGLSIRPQQ